MSDPTDDNTNNKGTQPLAPLQATSVAGLVVRSEVPPNLPYRDYIQPLRRDFEYSCGYCSTCEGEAEARRFTIDHYEPRSAHPNLVNTYANLVYSCEECNTFKGDRNPSASARAKGRRFFNPDTDVRADHFHINGEIVAALTEVGDFSIEFLDLNRLSLRRIRAIRRRLYDAHEHILDGLRALKSIPLDQVPPEYRMRAKRNMEILERVAERTQERSTRFCSWLRNRPC